MLCEWYCHFFDEDREHQETQRQHKDSEAAQCVCARPDFAPMELVLKMIITVVWSKGRVYRAILLKLFQLNWEYHCYYSWHLPKSASKWKGGGEFTLKTRSMVTIQFMFGTAHWIILKTDIYSLTAQKYNINKEHFEHNLQSLLLYLCTLWLTFAPTLTYLWSHSKQRTSLQLAWIFKDPIATFEYYTVHTTIVLLLLPFVCFPGIVLKPKILFAVFYQ